ncbi:tetratricopeptide repeat protein [Corallococcus terminator]|uniref:tetratricopeptide repeat protein n=1 Tax=Corallococcus terminator TaxID=2316733 RepID=UPI00131597F8|nr:tetratricopeptide repeat protein [Corallococcus terminator]
MSDALTASASDVRLPGPRVPGFVAGVCALLLTGCAHEPKAFPCGYERDPRAQCVQELREGHLDTAETYCDLALEFSPLSADLWATKGLISLSRGNLAKAKAHLLQALRYNPEHTHAHFHLGVLFVREADPRQAEAAFSECLRLDPANVDCRDGLERAQRAGDR